MESLNPIPDYQRNSYRLHRRYVCPWVYRTTVMQEIDTLIQSAPPRGPVAAEVAGFGLVHSGGILGGPERRSVLVKSILHPVEHVRVAVQNVVSLLGVRHQIEELIIRTVVPPGVYLLRGHTQLRRGEPAVGVAGVTLHQLVAALTEGGVVANLVHVVQELGARSRAAAQQVLPLAHAVDVGDGGISASRLHQGRVPVHHVDQAIVGRAAPLEQAG